MKNKHAVILGRKGGKVKSEAKAKAARENGKKGGHPKKETSIEKAEREFNQAMAEVKQACEEAVKELKREAL